MSEFYTIKEISKKFGYTDSSIRDWLRKGILKGTKIGRSWRISSLEVKRISQNVIIESNEELKNKIKILESEQKQIKESISQLMQSLDKNGDLNIHGITILGDAEWPLGSIGKSLGRTLITGNDEAILIINSVNNNIKPGNQSTLFLGARSGKNSDKSALGIISGGKENDIESNLESFITLSTTKDNGASSLEIKINNGKVEIKGNLIVQGNLDVAGTINEKKE